MKKQITRYKVVEGREVTLPRGIARAPTGDNMRLLAGETFDVDSDNPEIAVHERFLRGRVRAGDLVIEERSTPTATRKEGDR